MGLEKGIKYGKEKRKPYRGAKAVDKTCRNHGSDDWEKANRMFRANREKERTEMELEDYIKENLNKTVAELNEELYDLNNRKFMLSMQDHWEPDDFRYDKELSEKIMKIKKAIKEKGAAGGAD